MSCRCLSQRKKNKLLLKEICKLQHLPTHNYFYGNVHIWELNWIFFSFFFQTDKFWSSFSNFKEIFYYHTYVMANKVFQIVTILFFINWASTNCCHVFLFFENLLWVGHFIEIIILWLMTIILVAYILRIMSKRFFFLLFKFQSWVIYIIIYCELLAFVSFGCKAIKPPLNKCIIIKLEPELVKI